MWAVSGSVAGGTTGVGPIVTVAPVTVILREIHFATPAHGNPNWHYIYDNSSNNDAVAGQDLHDWARGDKIMPPEWAYDGQRNLNSCWTRNAPVSVRVKLLAATTSTIGVRLTCTPILNGQTTPLTPVTVDFVYPANALEVWVDVPLGGNLPNEIGRHDLELRWSVTSGRVNFLGPRVTRHRIYSIYGQPFDPEHDSRDVADPGRHTTRDQGTLTGTKKRFDHMMGLLGPTKRHSVATQRDLEDLFWKVHVGINDRDPPYFEGTNDEYITTGPANSGTRVPLEDSWLAFCRTRRIIVEIRRPPVHGHPRPPDRQVFHWNDASCIGLVQVAKTMLAAAGLFARRAWVLPTTTRMPDGSTVPVTERDLYVLGDASGAIGQTHDFDHEGHIIPARPCLMDPEGNWEFFEGCLLTPSHKFLPGGYPTSHCNEAFRINKGFNSAQELLQWWCTTSRHRFRRFMAWACDWEGTPDDALDPHLRHYWDVDGNHYNANNYVQIRDLGKQLPPP